MSANYLRKYLFAAALLTFGVVAFTPSLQPVAMAQTNISGDIVGTVTDPQGAVVPGATVTVVSIKTGATKTATTGVRGEYRVSQLLTGDYEVSVTAPNFETSKLKITIAAAETQNGNVTLAVGQNSTTVEVTESAPLLNTQDADISTSFSMSQVQNLPNPGNDLTFIAQTSPGAVMNTQGGYGNFSVFGLPATSNTFTVNGGYENDPFLNLSNSGATNLLLGNNDVSDVTVTSNAYTASFGGLGGAQVSEISRSGGNGFHGNAVYWWNGSSMNANNYFNNQTDTPKGFSNSNQWAGAIGGPIKKDKSFFFFNTEGLRVIIPVPGNVFGPTPAFIASTLASIPTSEVPFYTQLFKAYTDNPAYCATCFDANDPNAVVYRVNGSNLAKETLYTGRIDQVLGANDHLFGHAKIDKGTQPTSTNLVNSAFNAESPQPEYEGQLNETHTFTPALTNSFTFAAIYYRAIFTQDEDAAHVYAPFSFYFQGTHDISPVNGSGYVFPQGRNVTGYQFIDDLSWSKGNHTIKAGWSMRRDDVTDYNPQVLAATQLAEAHYASFQAGFADVWEQQFPDRLTQPVALYTMGAYIQDDWKALPNLTLNFGLRLEHNSNPTCITNCYARFSQDFQNLPTDPTTPFNSMISSGQHRVFQDYQKVAYEPRVGFAWQPKGSGGKTVIRGGFGMFADSFPAQIADSLLNNAPVNVGVELLGPYYGGPSYYLDPSSPASAGAAASATAAALKADFNSGASAYDIGQIGFTSATHKINYATYEEWSLEVQQQLTRTTSLDISYVGNHGYHEPVVNGSANAFNTGGGFAALPQVDNDPILGPSGPNPSYAGVTTIYSGASSNYNGLIVSVVERARWLTAQINYAYSHALDEISNGGFNGFSANSQAPINPYNLAQNYGNADYDTRHYISGSYVIDVPHKFGPKILTADWQVSGTVFHSDGYPETMLDDVTAANFGNYTGALPARQLVASLPSHCSGYAHILNLNTGVGTPCAAANDVGFATNFGQQERNQVFGPGYTDTDMTVQKGFHIPGWESSQLKLGVQFFNLLNHPNFAQPNNTLSSGGQLGTISGTVNTPTSILGSFLGGDASPRLIQLKAQFIF